MSKKIKKKVDEENRVLLKLDNKWEFIAYVLKYRLKEILAVSLFIATLVLVLQNSGIDFNGIIKSIFGGSK